MINLIVTIFGGLMIIAGFYAMSFGFATPPNLFLFLGGLCIAVLGLFLIVIFSSGIEMPQRTPSPAPKTVPQQAPVMKSRPKPVKVQKEVTKEDKRKETIENIEAIKPRPRIRKPKKVDRPDLSMETKEKEVPKTPTETKKPTIGMKEIKPMKKADIGESTTLPPEASKSSEIKKSVVEPVKKEPVKPEPIIPKKTEAVKPEETEQVKPEKTEPIVEEPEPKKKIMPRIRRPKINLRSKAKPENEIKPEIEPKPEEIKPEVEPKPKSEAKLKDEIKPKSEAKTIGEVKPEVEAKPMGEVKPEVEDIKVPEEGKKIAPIKTEEPSTPKKPPMPKRPNIEKLKAAQADKEDEYVKKRLDRLKESYIQNAKDIESIIDERLDSFKGTLGKLKSESREPGIIWSFDAGDVQEAMTDIISKANSRILMMYPWIRNIDVGILKKFMDTECSIIVQEASLDDDASVELLKLLIDKDVKVRTMPHVHTIAIVADDTNGLIISTDPIYESYEVGVIYKDQKSIEEIENLFEDAWELSQDVDLEIK